jgi:antirestriction protein ArdC
MSSHTTRVRASNDRASLYTEITDKIIAELEAGRIPWVQPWGTAAIEAPLGMPRNAATQRGYSGINVLILWGAVIEHGFSGQSWLTFRQALGLGGHVRKGERGTTVVYADRFTPDDERQRAAEAGEEPGAIPFLKRFTVFNIDQCDGLPKEIAMSVVPPPPGQIEPRAEALIAATGADFRIGGGRAYYNTTGDFVQVPPAAAYFEPINWHRTAFHELGHWTGHASRLNRSTSGTGNNGDIIQALRRGSSDSLNQTGQKAVQRNLNIQPTLTIRPGFPVRVIVNRDLVLEPYRG